MDDDLSIDVQIQDPAWRNLVPEAESLAIAAIRATLGQAGSGSGRPAGEVCLILGDDAASRQLNAQFRGIDKPTNVLSFPDTDEPPPGEPARLGDIHIAAGVTGREAGEQGKTTADHLVHLVVHGVLHLLGFDHLSAAEARVMEDRERLILAGLGIADPYDGEPLDHDEVPHE